MSEDKDQHEDGKDNMSDAISVILGATVPTGFEYTAAEEVKEKTGADVKISKDRGRIYFRITTQHLHLVRTHAAFPAMQSHSYFRLLLIISLSFYCTLVIPTSYVSLNY